MPLSEAEIASNRRKLDAMREADVISPAAYKYLYENAATVDKTTVDQHIAAYARAKEQPFTQKGFWQSVARGVTDVAGLPGFAEMGARAAVRAAQDKYGPPMAGAFSPSQPGVMERPPIETVLPTPYDIQRRFTVGGETIERPPSNKGLQLAETVTAGGIGGLPNLIKSMARSKSGWSMLRAPAANVAGSSAAFAGSEVGGQLGGTKGALLGGLAATIAPGVVGTVARGGVMGAYPWQLGPSSAKRTAIKEALDLAEEATGGRPTVGIVTRGEAFRDLEGALSATPGAVGIMRTRAREVNQAAQRRLNEILGPRSANISTEELAGASILAAIDRKVLAVRNKGTQLYQDARRLIGNPQNPANTNRTRQALSDNIIGSKERRELIRATRVPGATDPDELAENILEELLTNPLTDQYQRLPYAVLDDLRRAVGTRLRNSDVIGTPIEGFYKQLYGAISDDLKDAAFTYGGAAGKRAVETASRYWRMERQIIDKVLRPIKNREPELEMVFRAAVNNNLTNSTRLRHVLSSATPRERDIISRAWIAKIGKLADDGSELTHWNIETFVRRWDNASDTGRRLMVSNTSYASDMTRFVKAMRGVVDARSALANPSGTAGKGMAATQIFYTMAAMTTAGAVAGGLISEDTAQGASIGAAASATTVVGALFGVNAVGRLMTNPSFVRWAADASAVPVAQIPTHLSRLSSIAAHSDDPQFVNDVDTFSSVFQDVALGGQQ